MRMIMLFGIVAMVPAALNTSPAMAHGVLAAALCTGDGIARTVSVPVGPAGVPGSDQPGCCTKGCHSGGTRKRSGKRLDPAQ